MWKFQPKIEWHLNLMHIQIGVLGLKGKRDEIAPKRIQMVIFDPFQSPTHHSFSIFFPLSEL